MAIEATIRRFGHSSGGNWWSHDDQAWVGDTEITPVPMSAVEGIPDLYEAELVPANKRGDEHTYVVVVKDTDTDLEVKHVINVDASPSPNMVVEWTSQGDHGPTQAVRALYESAAAAAAATSPYTDADKVEAVTIEYDEGTGRRSRYKQIES